MINRFFVIVLALGVFISATMMYVRNQTSVQAQTVVQSVQQHVPQSRTQMQLSFAPVVKQVSPAVVNIYTKVETTRRLASPFMDDPFFSQFFGRGGLFGGQMRRQMENALGSGVIIDADGLVITNAHVVKNAQEITVVLQDGREMSAQLALADEASDLALLRVDDVKESLPFAMLKPSESLDVGDLVLAIGNPFGVGQTVTSGIVSAQGSSALDVNDFNFFIQTDAAINPGNSGGPLVALDGGVVGINTAIYSRSGGSLGLGFAVPSEMVATIVAAEKSGRMGAQGVVRPWLGVNTQNITSDIAQSLDLDTPRGALVVSLHKASPLKVAGVKVGDVIISFNDRAVRDSSEMKFRMATVALGDRAQIEVLRDGRRKRFDVEAVAPPEDPPRNAMLIEGRNYLQGATIAQINPALSVELGGKIDAQEGVVIADVQTRSIAARIVVVGDVIIQVNGIDIDTVEQVKSAISNGQGEFSMIISRNGQKRQIALR